MMKEQQNVSEFIERHGIDSPVEFRVLDLVSEVGEIAKDINESTGYGDSRDEVEIKKDELGDVLFALLAVAEASGIDASDALDEALDKYEERLVEKGDPSSGDI